VTVMADRNGRGPGLATDDAHDPAIDARLTRYALAVSALAIGLVWWTTTTYPVHPAIALDWNSLDGSAAILVGVGYWSLFGLLGALRVRKLEGGAFLTLHMPFVVAGTILGGPVVGGWMGLLSQFERRELTEVPWYGVLANHTMIAIAAIAGGFAGEGVAQVVRSIGFDPGAEQFAAALTIAIVFAIVNLALVTPIIGIREQVHLREALSSWDSIFRATLFAEAILAWLMALVYVGVGWWAPIACVALVLVIWENGELGDEKDRDPMTGLLNWDGFRPHLSLAIREARRGTRNCALLVMDLDGFGGLNRDHGTLVGDEVIRATANRLGLAVRSTDYVARSHRAGDEFAVLFRNVPDLGVATMLAGRLRVRLSQPIILRSTDQAVSVGVSIGVLFLDESATAPEDAVASADRRMQYAKRNRLGVLADDPPSDTDEDNPGLAPTR